jgi:hypothetical protein
MSDNTAMQRVHSPWLQVGLIAGEGRAHGLGWDGRGRGQHRLRVVLRANDAAGDESAAHSLRAISAGGPQACARSGRHLAHRRPPRAVQAALAAVIKGGGGGGCEGLLWGGHKHREVITLRHPRGQARVLVAGGGRLVQVGVQRGGLRNRRLLPTLRQRARGGSRAIRRGTVSPGSITGPHAAACALAGAGHTRGFGWGGGRADRQTRDPRCGARRCCCGGRADMSCRSCCCGHRRCSRWGPRPGGATCCCNGGARTRRRRRRGRS